MGKEYTRADYCEAYHAARSDDEESQRKLNEIERVVFSRDRSVIGSGMLWSAPYPNQMLAFFWCERSAHGDDSNYWNSYYWIAIRETEDEGAFELIRIDKYGDIVENYPGRFESWDKAVLAANSLSKNWDQSRFDGGEAQSDDYDVDYKVKCNPWGDAVYQKEHPEGPVLTIFHMKHLSLYVAAWMPIAGSRCIPVPADFSYEADPAFAQAAIRRLAEAVFERGPTPKMIARSKSIRASYAANGKKGGRPKKGDAPKQ